MAAWFYKLRLRSSGLYCGVTRHRHQRYYAHFSGRGCRTTRLDPPIAVVLEEEFESFQQAFRREQQVKRWSRAKKESLIARDIVALRQLAKAVRR
ncbi:MAG: GIY-YIG nuclease family protein [Zoogloea sp.]|nr:MAG: GIY-YIG nuclease family protein [Zoogloea sp.]